MFSKRPVTDKQREILDFIGDIQCRLGHSPTMREIASHFGFRSVTTVADHLKALEKKGLIFRGKGARKISLSSSNGFYKNREQKNVSLVPMVGKVAAGTPILAFENIEEHFLIDKKFIRHDGVFLLHVSGDSMIDAHIQDGDYVFIKPQPQAERNDIVVAIIENEATIKRYIPHKDYIELKPENQNLESIKILRNHDLIRIIGKVVGVFHTF